MRITVQVAEKSPVRKNTREARALHLDWHIKPQRLKLLDVWNLRSIDGIISAVLPPTKVFQYHQHIRRRTRIDVLNEQYLMVFTSRFKVLSKKLSLLF